MFDFGIKAVVFDARIGETRILWDAGGYVVGWYWHNGETGELWRIQAGSAAVPYWQERA